MIEKVLELNGFTQKEAQIYIAVLEAGEATVGSVAAKTRLKRSTVYTIIEDLIHRGVLSEQTRFALAVAAFDRAVNAHDYPRAEQEAQAVVDSWYALPPVLAAPHRPVLLRAVEFLESYPFLSKLSLEQARALPDPHRPTQQFLGLLRQSSQNIPNGWARGAKNSVSAGIFTDLLAQTRAWLKANPTHPLRDLVELWQVRLRYFSGDTERISLMKFEVEKSDRQGLYAGRHCGDVHVRDLQVHRRHAQQLPRDPRSRHARRIGRRRVVYGPRRRDLRRELHRDV